MSERYPQHQFTLPPDAVDGGIVAEICRQVTGSRPFAFVGADNGSITRLVVRASGKWSLRSYNDTAHLDTVG